MDMAEQGLINMVYSNHSALDVFPFSFNGNLAAAVQGPDFWRKEVAGLSVLHYTWIKPFSREPIKECGGNNLCEEAINLWKNWAAAVPI